MVSTFRKIYRCSPNRRQVAPLVFSILLRGARNTFSKDLRASEIAFVSASLCDAIDWSLDWKGLEGYRRRQIAVVMGLSAI